MIDQFFALAIIEAFSQGNDRDGGFLMIVAERLCNVVAGHDKGHRSHHATMEIEFGSPPSSVSSARACTGSARR